MSNDQYSKMCYKILKNKEWYQTIPKSFIDKSNQKLYALIDGACYNGIIDKETWNCLRITYPVTPTFYSLPKVHKDLKNPPGRPIISGRGAITEPLSQFIDKYLRPLVATLPSYTRDTIHLLQIIDEMHIPSDTLLVAWKHSIAPYRTTWV